MTSLCERCQASTEELSALIDGELSPARREAIEALDCPRCAALIEEFRVVRRAVSVDAAVAASQDVASGWSRTDGATFLAAYRERRRGDGGEDLWRWIAVRLWPVSAGLLLGAFLALSDAGEPESAVDLEGQTLAFESAQAEIEPDLLGEMLAATTEETSIEAVGSEP